VETNDQITIWNNFIFNVLTFLELEIRNKKETLLLY